MHVTHTFCYALCACSEEGAEPAELWTALGGKGEYASSAALASQKDLPPPRLFHCSNAKGKFHIREVRTLGCV